MSDMYMGAAQMSPQEILENQNLANRINEELKAQKRFTKKTLDQEDFLRILVTQLTHQDPTAPMEDREFIAQMAQFSSLEQMMNMNATMGTLNEEFSKMANVISSGQVYSVLGKEVMIFDGERSVTGVVEEIIGREYPQVLVNGQYYDFNKVQKVRNKEASL